MMNDILEIQKNIIKKDKFKPFAEQPFQKVCPPLRKHINAILRIQAESDSVSWTDRVEAAKQIGIKAKDKKEIELDTNYNAIEREKALCIALFPALEPDALDWDELNSAEVEKALMHFFAKKTGIM